MKRVPLGVDRFMSIVSLAQNNEKIKFFILLLIVASLQLQIAHAKLGEQAPILLEKNLTSNLEGSIYNESHKIYDIDVSSNYILVAVGDTLHLYDIDGNEVWSHSPAFFRNISAVAISPSEEYVAVDVRYGTFNGIIHLIGMDKIPISSPIYYEGSKIDYFDLEKPNMDLNFVYKYGEKGYFLAMKLGQNNPVLTYLFKPQLNKNEVVWIDSGISNKTVPTSNWDIYGRTLYVGTERGEVELGKTHGGAFFNDSLFLRSTTLYDDFILTLINQTSRDDKVVWQLKKGEPIENLVFIKNGSQIVASSGGTFFILDNPLIEDPIEVKKSSKFKIVVLANSIDFGLASNFFGFLKNKGVEVIHTTSDNFDQFKNEKTIVVLGGPDAYGGIGEIVQSVLSEVEQKSIREAGARKKYVKSNVWTNDQRVMVIAGSDRSETKMSEDENKEDVASLENVVIEHDLPGAVNLSKPKFEIFLDQNRDYRFQLRAPDRKIIFTSGGYKLKADCLKDIEFIMENAPEIEIVDLIS